jgi:predicted PurR-regulated permease PerM
MLLTSRVAEEFRRRLSLDLPWTTILKVIAAAALVWLWLQLVQLVLVLVVAVLLAVTLDPVMEWFERRGWPRWRAALLIFLALLAAIGGFGWLAWNSVSDQAALAGKHLAHVQQDVLDKVPQWIQDAVGDAGSGEGLSGNVTAWVLGVGRSAVSALVVSVLGLILTMYLVIEAQTTRDWVMAFVPKDKRGRARQTLEEAQRVVFAYVAGNVLTSVLAGLFVFVLLTIATVPSALLLALIAALFDFVPVLGFIVSGIFAVAMALIVSPTTALIVGGLYVCYHLLENYVLSPWAYGDRLKLSNVAVILAFAVGATLAGVIGALIALPIAAAYPAIERIWLRDALPPETVGEHRAIETKGA